MVVVTLQAVVAVAGVAARLVVTGGWCLVAGVGGQQEIACGGKVSTRQTCNVNGGVVAAGGCSSGRSCSQACCVRVVSPVLA